jgi:hypothetical protein
MMRSYVRWVAEHVDGLLLLLQGCWWLVLLAGEGGRGRRHLRGRGYYCIEASSSETAPSKIVSIRCRGGAGAAAAAELIEERSPRRCPAKEARRVPVLLVLLIGIAPKEILLLLLLGRPITKE